MKKVLLFSFIFFIFLGCSENNRKTSMVIIHFPGIERNRIYSGFNPLLEDKEGNEITGIGLAIRTNGKTVKKISTRYQSSVTVELESRKRYIFEAFAWADKDDRESPYIIYSGKTTRYIDQPREEIEIILNSRIHLVKVNFNFGSEKFPRISFVSDFLATETPFIQMLNLQRLKINSLYLPQNFPVKVLAITPEGDRSVQKNLIPSSNLNVDLSRWTSERIQNSYLASLHGSAVKYGKPLLDGIIFLVNQNYLYQPQPLHITELPSIDILAGISESIGEIKNGKYELTNILPGKYYAIFIANKDGSTRVEDIFEGLTSDPLSLGTIYNVKAQYVNLRPGDLVKLETVDLTPPLTYLTRYPTYPKPLTYTGTVSGTSALFEFFSSAEYAIFECSLDGGEWHLCTSPYSVKVDEGIHTFSVRSIDQYGNLGPVVTYSWIVKITKWRTISTGPSHACGVKDDGTLWCWGYNSEGEVGEPGRSFISYPEQISPTIEWVTVSAGYNHTCGIDINGDLYCWGDNSYGELGNGTFENSPYPVKVLSSEKWSDVKAGYLFTCGLTTDNIMECWGDNTSGKLGDGGIEGYRNYPSPVTGPFYWEKFAVGDNHTCAINMNDHTVWCWGKNNNYQLGITTVSYSSSPTRASTRRWLDISASSDHTCAVSEDGSLWCWGYENYFPGDVEFYYGMTQGSTGNPPHKVTDSTDWTSVSCGVHQNCALKNDGSLWCWGRNVRGVLMDLQGNIILTPVQTGTSSWQKISIGDDYICAIKDDGTLWCWGKNNEGEVGTGESGITLYPEYISSKTIDNFALLSAGSSFVIATSYDSSELYGWGKNIDHEIFSYPELLTESPFFMGKITEVSYISSGFNHVCVIAGSSDSLLCWGDNSAGEIGNGITSDSVTSPTTVTSGVFQVSAGAGYTCAIFSDSALKCWGTNNRGQLGTGNTQELHSPTLIGTNWQYISTSKFPWHQSTCGIKTDGSLWCWGDNNWGQGGSGFYSEKITIPVQSGTGNNWSKVSVGGRHVCAIDNSYNLYCWGDNGYGQLGLGKGSEAEYNTPQFVGTDFIDVSAGSNHTCGVKLDGSVWCWGDNSAGQVGAGDINLTYSSPVMVIDSGGIMVETGEGFTCAVRQTEYDHYSLMCWGNNYYGETGNGKGWSYHPVKVTTK